MNGEPPLTVPQARARILASVSKDRPAEPVVLERATRGELTGPALETSTGELHTFLAKPTDSEADNVSAAPAEPGGAAQTGR